MKSILIKRTLKYLKPYRLIFVVAVLCMIVYGATDGIVPFLVKQVLDKVFREENRKYLYLFPIVLMVLSLVRSLADFGQQYFSGKVGHSIVRDLRNEMNAHLLNVGPDFFVRNASGDLLSRITGDVLLLRILLTDVVAAVVRDAVRVVALLIAALWLDPLLSLIALCVLPIGVYPIIRFGKRMRSLGRRGQDSIGTLSSMLHETILGNRVIKIFGMERQEQSRFEKENENLTRTFVKSEKIRALTGPVNEVLASLAISGVILYGGSTVISGARTEGEFIAFLIAVFLLYDPIKKLSKTNSTVQQGLGAAERIFEFLDQKPRISEVLQPQKLSASNEIVISKVSYTYPGSAEEALQDISLTIPEGQKMALVGLSGSGKTTLVDLVPRFIDPTQGKVTIGGVDISQVALEQLRSKVSMVSQHTFLFNESLYNNILYGRIGASAEEVRDAARRAHALDFIDRLPNGLETQIGEGGFTLSGGERQRISIARAILKNSPILILDEATAALDNRSEQEVQQALSELERNRTTIVIAHRLSTIVDADCILVLKAGQIVEKGTHEELLRLGGEYSSLHRK
jgi:subfamily B ATP-binding cassette protein MsbA